MIRVLSNKIVFTCGNVVLTRLISKTESSTNTMLSKPIFKSLAIFLRFSLLFYQLTCQHAI